MDSHASLVDLIFAKCSLVYGRDFLDRWQGQDMGEVKADWRRELQGVLDHPLGIKHALEHLPVDRPPTVLQFRALCINRPHMQPPALPAPKASNAAVAAAMARSRIGSQDGDPKAWAHRLREREKRGDSLSAAQRTMWRAAIDPAPVAEVEES